MLRPGLRSAVLFIILIAASAVPCFAISKDFNQSYPLQAGGTFELQNVNGPVEVQGWDRDVVEIRAVKIAETNSRTSIACRSRWTRDPMLSLL